MKRAGRIRLRSIVARAMVAGLLALWFAGLTEAQRDGNAPTETLEPGRMTYMIHCSSCHGLSGEGDGNYVEELDGDPPRDFTQGLFKYRSSMGRATPDDLARTIRRGMAGTEMPGFHRSLSEKEALELAVFILRLSPPGEEGAQLPPFTVPEETVDDEASRSRGREYFREDCAGCHGMEGRGDGPRSQELVSKWGHRVQPRDLTTGVFPGGDEPAEIFRNLATGLEGIPMPPYEMLREPEEIWDLVHYIRSLQKQDEDWLSLVVAPEEARQDPPGR